MPYNLNVRGWISEHELKVIESWAQSLPNNSHVIEIGSFYGRSACCWAASITKDSTLYCYDQWQGDVEENQANIPIEIRLQEGYPLLGDINTYENFKENIKNFDNIKHKQVSDSTSIDWTGPEVDIVFIDVAHSNPADWDYIQYWLPKIKKGGFICGHDYNIGYADVDSNVQKLELLLKTSVETFSPGTLWKITI
jgi:predicted O-methyltransferase YrrM